MADRWRREDDKSRQNKDKTDDGIDGWGLFGAIAGTVLLAGAAGYAVSQLVKQDEKQEEETPIRTSPYSEADPSARNCISNYRSRNMEVHDFSDDTIIIGVDATEGRAGGILVLPKTKIIYFYSIDWSDVFQFPSPPEPDKFELTNVLLALEIFKDYVQFYRDRWDSECSLELKTDSPIGSTKKASSSYRGFANIEYRKFYESIDTKLKSRPFYGKWKQEESSEKHIKMADRLSRVDYSHSMDLPKQNLPDYFEEYKARNLSKTDPTVLDRVANQVPSNLLK